jgi:hypothetical protein
MSVREDCPATLMIAGTYYTCDYEAGHPMTYHHNKVAEAIWEGCP